MGAPREGGCLFLLGLASRSGLSLARGELETSSSRRSAATSSARQKKSPGPFGPGHRSGNDLLSHRVTPAVPSALEGLTTEFGMGSGVALPPSSPENLMARGVTGETITASRSNYSPPQHCVLEADIVAALVTLFARIRVLGMRGSAQWRWKPRIRQSLATTGAS